MNLLINLKFFINHYFIIKILNAFSSDLINLILNYLKSQY